jgi:hypothetical protein
MFNHNTLQLRNKIITVNTVCYSIFLYFCLKLTLNWPSELLGFDDFSFGVHHLQLICVLRVSMV